MVHARHLLRMAVPHPDNVSARHFIPSASAGFQRSLHLLYNVLYNTIKNTAKAYHE